MHHFPGILIALLALAPMAAAQMTNGPSASLVVNGIDGAAPNEVHVPLGNPVELAISGPPFRPFELFIASSVSVGELTFIAGNLELDIGPIATAGILLDGVGGTGFFDMFANTGPGTANFSLPTHSGIPTGPLLAFQAFVVDTTSAPFFVYASAATGVTIDAPTEYGTVVYARGGSVEQLENHQRSTTAGPQLLPSPSPSYGVRDLRLVRYEEFYGNTARPGNIDRRQPPRPDRPLVQRENVGFPHLRTVYGDVYHFHDQVTSEAGFMLSLPGGGLVEIPESRQPSLTVVSPWKSEVAIDSQSRTLAAVLNPLLGPDRVYLIKIDGSTFASGSAVEDVTPMTAQPNLIDESLTFSKGALYFVDGNQSGRLFRVDAGGGSPPVPVAIPPLGTGQAATITDGELFVHAPTGDVYFQSGTSASSEDLYRLTAISATGETVINVSNFPLPRAIAEFGDAYDGVDGMISVSPGGASVGFGMKPPLGGVELFVAPTDASAPPIQITSDARFDAQIDTLCDLNHYDDDHLLFFAGVSPVFMDLYCFEISGSSIGNTTQTNGQDGSILPIAFSPLSEIDPEGYFTLPGRMVFTRGGHLVNGFLLGPEVLNLVGLEYQDLEPYNITGSEFSGPSTPDIHEESPRNLELGFAETIDAVWFSSSRVQTSDDELFIFDPMAKGLAIQVTANGTNGGGEYRNLNVDPGALTCLASWRPYPSAADRIGVATWLQPGFNVFIPATIVQDEVTDGSLRWMDSDWPLPGFVYSRGARQANSAGNPANARLFVFDLANGATTVLDPTPAAYWIFSLTPP